jgi:tRNA modification GTPase
MFTRAAEYLDTIYALSSGFGKSAIAIVRVSGAQCDHILEQLCPRIVFKDREAKLAWLRTRALDPIDRAVVVRYFAPRSYTGEDMVEFQVTGSRAVLAELLKSLSLCPQTRPAEAGEFASRAFENGKLDLVEVEGLATVLAAETSAQLRHAVGMAGGALSLGCEGVRTLVLRAIAEVEALLDFSDVEDAENYALDGVRVHVEEARTRLLGMLTASGVSERLRDGMTVVIGGAPNVGKSTMLNYLAARDVAIVSAIPGTTRDSLEVAAEIAGFPVTFIDTAGIRATDDPLEAQGIARSVERSKRADLVLWLFDGQGADRPEPNLTAPVQRVRTKVDVGLEFAVDGDTVAVSTKTGLGIDRLLAAIEEFARRHFEGAGSVLFGTERQRSAVREALGALESVLGDANMPTEIVAEELRAAARSLSRITGRIEIEEVLAEIFSRLCVGK